MPDGLCECGCGERTNLARQTRRGDTVGQPLRFVRGHVSRGRKASAESRATKIGARNPRWRGGRVVSRGYIRVLVDGKYKFEHRLVMVEIVGRELQRGEVVHHVNETRDDNRRPNLWLFPDRGSHLAWHRLLRDGQPLDVFMPAVAIG